MDAQDTLILLEGKAIIGTVDTVQETFVTLSNINGHTGSKKNYAKEDIYKIKYQNGKQLLVNERIITFGEKEWVAKENFLRRESDFWQNRYYMGTQKISRQQFLSNMKQDKDINRIYSIGQSLSVLGNLTAFSGSFMLGYQLGNKISGKQVNNNSVYIGLGMTLLGIGIGSSGEKKIAHALNLHNRSHIHVGMTNNGIGLSWSLVERKSFPKIEISR